MLNKSPVPAASNPTPLSGHPSLRRPNLAPLATQTWELRLVEETRSDRASPGSSLGLLQMLRLRENRRRIQSFA